MTLLPIDDWSVKGVDGDTYKVGPYCAAPGCKKPVDHKHHLWRRSYLAGNFWWVKVPFQNAEAFGLTTIRNVVGLCWRHHEDVTGQGGGHAAWIRWDPQRQNFHWLERTPDDKFISIGTFSLPAAPPADAAPSSPEGREAERCPTCGKRQGHPHPEHEPGPKRPAKSWTIKVPADDEDGAVILNELVEGCAEIFGHDEYTSRLKRYYTVVQALSVVLQNRERIAAEVDA
jgi:hypothetical protein